MGCIGGKLAHLGEGCVKAAEHIVYGFGEPVKLIAGAGEGEPFVETVRADLAGAGNHPVYGTQRPVGEEPAPSSCQDKSKGEEKCHGEEKPRRGSVEVDPGHAHPDHRYHPPRIHDRPGEYPYRICLHTREVS